MRAARPHAAGDTVWGRSRDHQRSATVADLFTEAGLDHGTDLLQAYREFWEPRTLTDPQVVPLFTRLRGAGIRVGVLSNTIWPRAWHEEFFRRDGVDHLIDAGRLHERDPVDQAVAGRGCRRAGRGRRHRRRLERLILSPGQQGTFAGLCSARTCSHQEVGIAKVVGEDRLGGVHILVDTPASGQISGLPRRRFTAQRSRRPKALILWMGAFDRLGTLRF
ncbi:MAG TPA: hypothetical protein VIR30_20435 [Nocardioides sp.]